MRRRISIFEKILKKYLYFGFWFSSFGNYNRGKELMFSAALASTSIIQIILIGIIFAFFQNTFIKLFLDKVFKTNKILGGLVVTLPLIPLVVYFYRKYKIYYNEFMRRIERKKRRRYLSDKCVKCGRSFKEARRYENTNLCEECFNKSLEGEE